MPREKDYTAKLLLTLRRLPKSWWYKIPDPAACPKCGAISMVSKRPYDIVGSYKGSFIAIEVKMDSLKSLRPHQEAALRLVDVAGGYAICYVQGVLHYIFEGNWCLYGETTIQAYLEDVL